MGRKTARELAAAMVEFENAEVRLRELYTTTDDVDDDAIVAQARLVVAVAAHYRRVLGRAEHEVLTFPLAIQTGVAEALAAGLPSDVAKNEEQR